MMSPQGRRSGTLSINDANATNPRIPLESSESELLIVSPCGHEIGAKAPAGLFAGDGCKHMRCGKTATEVCYF